MKNYSKALEREPDLHLLKMSIFRLSSLKDLCALEHLTIPFLNPRGLPDQCTYEGHSKFFIDHFPASLKTLRITGIEFNLIAETLLNAAELVKRRNFCMPSLNSTSLEPLKETDSRRTFSDDLFLRLYLSDNDPTINGQFRLDLEPGAGLLMQHNALYFSFHRGSRPP